MSKLYLLLALVVVAAVVSVAQGADSDDTVAFAQFNAKFRKNFRSSAQRQASFAKFRKNRAHVQEVNADPAASYQIELNQFGDLSVEDMVEEYTGLEVPAEGFRSDPIEPVSARMRRQAAPANYDLSRYGSVWSQGKCGSCWAFTAVEALEIKLNLVKGGNITLSEQQLVDCARIGILKGCNGGWPAQGWDWLNTNKGAALASEYPYTAVAHTHGISGSCLNKKFNTPFTKISYVNLPALNPNYWVDQMVKFSSPIAVAIYVNDNFQLYKSGVYFESASYPEGKVNHAVLVTGYGVDAVSKLPYWKVKNSWGTGWGEGGYIRIYRGSNVINIERYGMMPQTLL